MKKLQTEPNADMRYYCNRLFQAVIVGNLEAAIFIAKFQSSNGGYGLNEFHVLALTGKTEEEVGGVKRINLRKKAFTC